MEGSILYSVTVLLTCHNRREYTKKCIESLSDDSINIRYVIANDGSTDGTEQMLQELAGQHRIQVIEGNGQLFWGGGMRKVMEYVKTESQESDYYLLVNDDVDFVQGAIGKTIEDSIYLKHAVIVGITQSKNGQITYGGVKYIPHSIRYVKQNYGQPCDTFNCNYVLLPKKIFMAADNFDKHYTHAMADFDYGLQIKRMGYPIYTGEKPVGICEKNEIRGTWQDRDLSPFKRIKLKESVKGLPYKEWFYFLRKNFGLGTAVVRTVTPYGKILMGKY